MTRAARGVHYHLCDTPGCREPGLDKTGWDYRWYNPATAQAQEYLPPQQDPAVWVRERRPWGRISGKWEPVDPAGAALLAAVAMAAAEPEDHRAV